MATKTTNIQLSLPLGSERVSRQLLNQNFSTIDAVIGALPEGTNLVDTIAGLINDSAGDGTTNKTWSANKIYDQLALKALKANAVFTGSIRMGASPSAVSGSNSIVTGTGAKSVFNNEVVSGVYNAVSPIPTENFSDNKVYHKGDFVRWQTYSLVCMVDNSTQPSSPGTPNVSEWRECSQWLEIVGNGYNDSARENARVLEYNGNEHLRGTLYVNANADGTGGTPVATASDISGIGDAELISGDDYCIAI